MFSKNLSGRAVGKKPIPRCFPDKFSLKFVQFNLMNDWWWVIFGPNLMSDLLMILLVVPFVKSSWSEFGNIMEIKNVFYRSLWPVWVIFPALQGPRNRWNRGQRTQLVQHRRAPSGPQSRSIFVSSSLFRVADPSNYVQVHARQLNIFIRSLLWFCSQLSTFEKCRDLQYTLYFNHNLLQFFVAFSNRTNIKSSTVFGLRVFFLHSSKTRGSLNFAKSRKLLLIPEIVSFQKQ